MPKGANVLLECSMQEGYAWIGETDESAGRSLVLFFTGRWHFLYEYLRWIERGICMITLVFSVPIAIVKVLSNSLSTPINPTVKARQ